MKTIKINVSKTDIKNGKPGDPYHCPIFLAAKRHRLGMITASHNMLVFTRERWCSTPIVMERWMRAFDQGHKVKPKIFTFTNLLLKVETVP